MIPIIRWSLLQRKWSIFWWSVGVFALIFINMIFYPSFKDQAAELQKSFKNLPDATLQFIGGSSDFFSEVGFLNSQIFFLMLPLLLGVLAIGLGSSVLAREEQEKTAEALLARPISRTRLLFGKGSVAVIILLFVSLIGLVTTLVTIKLVDLNISSIKILQASLLCFLLALSFAAIAFLLTALGRMRSAAIGIATSISFGGYIISSLAGTVEWLKFPSKLLPFHYYQPEAVLGGNYDWSNSIFLIALILSCGIISWITFRRRDIR